MTLIGVHGVSKYFGARPIFQSLDFTVEPSARIGLIGANGAGKSTLLKILAGLQDVEAGQVVRKRGLRVAYLPQHITGDERTPIDVTVRARQDLLVLQAKLDACEARLLDPTVTSNMIILEQVLAEQEQLLQPLDELGGAGIRGEARATLLSLGLPESDLTRRMSDLSGGQRKTVVLASCLAQRPDVLLLDEPETHLDMTRQETLERLVQEFAGAVVVVSHDRYLLDETINHIAEIQKQGLRDWPGNYSAYAVARELVQQRQQVMYATQQKEIARLEEAVHRFEQWARQVVNERHIRQARVKQRQIDQMEKVERPVLERRKIALRLRSAERGGQKVFELRDVYLSFDGHEVLSGLNVSVMRGAVI